MINIKVSADCGNSPKNLFLRDFSLAFARGDSGFILSRVSDDILWTRVGDRELRGKQELLNEIGLFQKDQLKEIGITHVLSHGKAGAVDGIKILNNNLKIFFSDFYDFANAKGDQIKAITSYLILIEE